MQSYQLLERGICTAKRAVRRMLEDGTEVTLTWEDFKESLRLAREEGKTFAAEEARKWVPPVMAQYVYDQIMNAKLPEND